MLHFAVPTHDSCRPRSFSKRHHGGGNAAANALDVQKGFDALSPRAGPSLHRARLRIHGPLRSSLRRQPRSLS